MNHLNSITTHIKLNHLVCTDLSLLYQAMTGNYYKKLPFAVMPMLPLGYTWLTCPQFVKRSNSVKLPR